MSGLNARLFPAPLSFPHPLQRPPARRATETLQRTAPPLRKSLVAARPITAMIEKNVPQ
jgi:hypothetical protein